MSNTDQRGAQTLEIGKTYDVTHSRKGTFALRVQSQDDEWVTGIILDGKANAMMDYNKKLPGEEITIRKSFCKFESAQVANG